MNAGETNVVKLKTLANVSSARGSSCDVFSAFCISTVI
jgi:hypothetical protein